MYFAYFAHFYFNFATHIYGLTQDCGSNPIATTLELPHQAIAISLYDICYPFTMTRV